MNNGVEAAPGIGSEGLSHEDYTAQVHALEATLKQELEGLDGQSKAQKTEELRDYIVSKKGPLDPNISEGELVRKYASLRSEETIGREQS